MSAYANATKFAVLDAVTYVAIHDGYKEAYAYATAAWRLADSATPASDRFVTVAAGDKILLPFDVVSYARGDSGASTVNVIITNAGKS